MKTPKPKRVPKLSGLPIPAGFEPALRVKPRPNGRFYTVLRYVKKGTPLRG